MPLILPGKIFYEKDREKNLILILAVDISLRHFFQKLFKFIFKNINKLRFNIL